VESKVHSSNDNRGRDVGLHDEKAVEIAKAAGAAKLNANPRRGKYSIVPYQSTHNTGGAVMARTRRRAPVNKYLQSWDVPNLFVVGASAFPQNGGYNPTGTVAP